VVAKLASDQGSAVRNFIDELLDRFDDLKNWGWRQRGRVTAEGIVFSILLGTLLTVGIVAAWAVTGSDAETSYATPSTTPVVSPSVTNEVVTETIKRNGKAIRIVRRRTLPGDTVLETVPGRGTTLLGRSVTLPGRTVRETHTVTTREVATVTQSVTVTVQPETVTIIETVKCKPKDC
jgi:hypothetical protein